MKQFCKNHKFWCVVFAAIAIIICINGIYFFQDKGKHQIAMDAVRSASADLKDTPEYADYISGVYVEASRGCGRGQGKFGPGALQCDARIKLEGKVFGAWQTKHLLLSFGDVLKRHNFSFQQADWKSLIPSEDTQYLTEVISLSHTKSGVECGLWYEYLNDEEKNENRMYPVDLPYVTISIGCDDMARLEKLLDKEIL